MPCPLTSSTEPSRAARTRRDPGTAAIWYDALDESSSACAVAVTAQLRANRTATIRFALSWDFPQVVYHGGGSIAGFPEVDNGVAGQRAIWMRRYTEFLGARSTPSNDYVPGSYPFQQAFTIAQRELARHDASLASVEAWWRPIAENENYPLWLRRAALNELYELVFNATFWEAGLVDSTTPAAPGGPRLGAEIPETHLFYFIDAGSGGAAANEMGMDSAGYLAYTKLFPNIELGRIRAWPQLVKQTRSDACPSRSCPEAVPTSARQQESRESRPIHRTSSANRQPDTDDLGALFDPSGGNSFRDCAHKLIHRTFALYRETGTTAWRHTHIRRC